MGKCQVFMLSLCRQMDRRPVKQYAPDLSMRGHKNSRKRIKCWLPAFSPFPTMFSKAFFFRVFKSQDCAVELTLYSIDTHFNASTTDSS